MKNLVGVIHFPIDAYNSDVKELKTWLARNLQKYQLGGFSSVMLQDQVIESRASIETISRVSILCNYAREKFPDIKLGLILDSNDCEAAIKIALMNNFDFVRLKVFVGAMVKNTGIVTGCASSNYKLIQEAKRRLEIFADIYDKTGTPLGNISHVDASIYALKMGATSLILTGGNSNETNDIIENVSSKVLAPVYVGGGVTADNIDKVSPHATGVVVSSCLLEPGSINEWSEDKIRELVRIVSSLS